MEIFALFCRIKYQGQFRAWQFSGFETDPEKVRKFVTDCQAENGLESTCVFSMHGGVDDVSQVFKEKEERKVNKAQPGAGVFYQ